MFHQRIKAVPGWVVFWTTLWAAAAFAANAPDTLWNQGSAAFAASDYESARRYFGQACAPEIESGSPVEIGLCEHELGIVDYADGRVEHAEHHYLRALSAWEQTGERYNAKQVATLISLGRLYHAGHRFEDAARMLTRAVELARPLEALNPQLTAVALSRLGGLYSVSGDVDQGRSVLHEAIAKLRALPSPNLPELAWAYSSLGMIGLRDGSYAAGESDFRQAVSIATGALGENNQQQTAIYETNLGLALSLQGEYSRALPVLRRARFVLESRPGGNDVPIGTALGELATVETALGKFVQAEDDGSRALEIFNQRFPPGAPEIVRAQVNLASVYLGGHKTAEAAKILPNAVAAERSLLPGSRALGDGIRLLAQLRAQQRDWSQAESLFSEAIGIYEAQPGAAHPEIDTVRQEFAQVLKHRSAK